jgi:hypothetical protein
MSKPLNTPNLNNNTETDETDTLHKCELPKSNITDNMEGGIIVQIKKSSAVMAPK